MLWESVNPHERLAERFGFPEAASATEWVVDALQRQWQIDVTRCDRLVISAWNVMAWVTAGERHLIAKWSCSPKRFTRLEHAARVARWLEAQGVPVAAPMPATDGRLLVEFDNAGNGRLRSRLPLPGRRSLLGVFPVLEGDLLDVDEPAQVDAAGRMLAIVHEHLASYPERVGRRRPRAQQQLVHNDFRSANILHDGTRITAVLDLEEITYATRVADIAKSAVLLGTRYRDWGPTSKDIRTTYVAGYNDQARDPLSRSEKQELEDRMTAVLTSMGWL